MLNKEIYIKEPSASTLKNDGVAKVANIDEATLKYELETFVCEGEYQKGLHEIFSTFLFNLSEAQNPHSVPQQRAVWISGFYGSGKSHLAKMLKSFWENKPFSDGTYPRRLAELPDDVSDELKEFETTSRRYGGAHAAIGTLSGEAGKSVRLSVLSIILKSLGLPEKYNIACFVMFLIEKGYYDDVLSYMKNHDCNINEELDNLMVSDEIYSALVEVNPTLFSNVEMVAKILTEQFKEVSDISNDEFVKAVRRCMKIRYRDKFPLMLIAIDEVQQFIGGDTERSMQIQEVTEVCCSRFDGKVLIVGTGQSAINSTPSLKKLEGRYTVRVELSDTDVDSVVRKVVLAKKATALVPISNVMNENMGELSRQLQGTDIRFREEDKKTFSLDYPVLSMRRRFWDYALKAMDSSHTFSQLRNQLSLINSAVSDPENLNSDLGAVVPADFIYFESSTKLRNSNVISENAYENIERWYAGTPDEQILARAYALVFVIGQITKYKPDLGLKADIATIADLMVTDLKKGSSELRSKLEQLLPGCKELNLIGNEYRILTPVSAEWQNEYAQNISSLSNREFALEGERDNRLHSAFEETIKKQTKLLQGVTKTPRSCSICFDEQLPADYRGKCIIWVKDGWKGLLSDVRMNASKLGASSSVLCVFLPKKHSEDLRDYIKGFKAASQVLEMNRSTGLDSDSMEAKSAMETTRSKFDQQISQIMDEIISSATVFCCGVERTEPVLEQKISRGLEDCVTNLYPQFQISDHLGWDHVFNLAVKKDPEALRKGIDFQGNPEEHPVCKEILSFLSSEKKGSEVYGKYSNAPYGWSKDVIDGTLAVLFSCGKIKAVNEQRKPILAGSLERKNIGKASFALESPSISVKERLRAKNTIAKVLPGISGEVDQAMVNKFMDGLKDLQRQAGGEAPKPEVPSFDLISDLEECYGNAQLKMILDNKDLIDRTIEEWIDTKDRISKLWSQWIEYSTLISKTGDDSDFDDERNAYNAILSGRLLLSEGNPVQNGIKALETKYRTKLNALSTKLDSVWTKTEEIFVADSNWKQVPQEQKHQLRMDYKLLNSQKPDIKTGSVKEIIATLNQKNISALQDYTVAISANCQKVLDESARIVAPKLQFVSLDSKTLSSREEIEEWAGKARTTLLNVFEKSHGPIKPRC